MSNSASSFIKVYRNMLHWKWYKNSKVKDLFLHCLLRANWESGEWNGIHYEAGQFITSIASLAEETGLSKQEVRTALKHLRASGEISTQVLTQDATQELTQHKVAKCTLVTVKKWGQYQKVTQHPTQKATHKSTTEKEIIKRKRAESHPDGLASASDEEDVVWMNAYDDRKRAREEQQNERNL